jgi:hypothetical protein
VFNGFSKIELPAERRRLCISNGSTRQFGDWLFRRRRAERGTPIIAYGRQKERRMEVGGTAPTLVPPYGPLPAFSITIYILLFRIHQYSRAVALLQEKNFILGRKSLRDLDLNAILSTIDFYPTSGFFCQFFEMECRK